MTVDADGATSSLECSSGQTIRTRCAGWADERCRQCIPLMQFEASCTQHRPLHSVLVQHSPHPPPLPCPPWHPTSNTATPHHTTGWSLWQPALLLASSCSMRTMHPWWRPRRHMVSRLRWRAMIRPMVETPCCSWTLGATTRGCGTTQRHACTRVRAGRVVWRVCNGGPSGLQAQQHSMPVRAISICPFPPTPPPTHAPSHAPANAVHRQPPQCRVRAVGLLQ